MVSTASFLIVAIVLLASHADGRVDEEIDEECKDITEVKRLSGIVHTGECMTVADVFELLRDINDVSPKCRKNAIRYMNDAYHGGDVNTDHCNCNGFIRQVSFPSSVPGVRDFHASCLQIDSAYKDLYELFFTTEQTFRGDDDDEEDREEEDGVDVKETDCVTHQSIWDKLREVNTAVTDCQKELIYHVGYVFDKYGDSCRCTGPTSSTTTTSTSTTSTTSSTTPPTTSTSTVTSTSTATSTTSTTGTTSTTPEITTSSAPLNQFSCDKAPVIGSIAKGVHVTYPNVTSCLDILVESDESIVLLSCNVTSYTTWTRGAKVQDVCGSIPPFTPVATFTNENYIQAGAQVGIFLECLPTGFSMVVQYCNQGPEIIDITLGGVFNNDPSLYYVIA